MAELPGSFARTRGLENFFDLAHGAMQVQFVAVAGNDAGGFLAAMLQRVEAEIGEVGGFGVAEDAEHTTLVVEMIVGEWRVCFSSVRVAQTSSSFHRAFQRMRPRLHATLRRGCRSPRAPYIRCGGVVTDDLADLLRRHLILSRSLENASNQSRLHRDDRACAAFARRAHVRAGRRMRVSFWQKLAGAAVSAYPTKQDPTAARRSRRR